MKNVKFEGLLKESLILEEKEIKERESWINKKLLEFDFLLKENFTETLPKFSQLSLNYLSDTINAFKGVLYLCDDSNQTYKGVAHYGESSPKKEPEVFCKGEGMVGKTISSKKETILSNLPENKVVSHLALAKISIRSIYVFPLLFNKKVYGAVEFFFLDTPPPHFGYFLAQVSKSLAVMIENAQKHHYIQELLLESEKQKRELKSAEIRLSKSFEELSATNELLNEQSKKTDEAFDQIKVHYEKLVQSINYAKRIQDVFLTHPTSLKEAFKDFFLVYKPKDTVSGDFYWYYTYQNKQIIAVGDCTGHGVPGAFMSLLAVNLLEQIISGKKIFYPEVILDYLHDKIKKNLQKDGQELNDGMDISLCCIENKGNNEYEISFAGAKSDLYYIKAGKFNTIRGDRKTIGGFFSSQEHFTSQKIRLSSGDQLYMVSDGVIDVCNNKRVSFGLKKLKNLLTHNMRLTMDRQKEILLSALTSYQGGQDQRDDITALGIKL